MKKTFAADIHLHSKYSYATAKNSELETCAFWAAKKGLKLIGTGDFTHPAWLANLKSKLAPAETGLFKLKNKKEIFASQKPPKSCNPDIRFMLSAEISTIYKRGDKVRKVHHCVFAPDFESAEKINRELAKIGKLSSDGRPILKLDSRDLLDIVLASGEASHLVPAHIWTPWFSALGSKSGFDSIDECYGASSKHIFAVETGLSSDPPMNWRVPSLDRFRLISNSDAHSPPNLGREATLFDTALTYHAVFAALKTGDGYKGTIEFFPQEGKYHLDGHRKCGVRLTPKETIEAGGVCPVCGKPVTVGVLSRVEALAANEQRRKPKTAGEFVSLVPLKEIIAEIEGVGAKTKTVAKIFEKLLEELGPEIFILKDCPLEDVSRAGGETLAEALKRLRNNRVILNPGYDGLYGTVKLFKPGEI